MANTYWAGKGKQQETYEQLWEKLIPPSGPAKTKAGELLRAAARVYYRWYNDGDRIEPVLDFGLDFTSAVNGWGFLYAYRDGEFSGEPLALAILAAASESEYETRLEEAVDAVLTYIANAAEEPNGTDFTDEKYTRVFDFETTEDEEYDEY